MTSSDCLVTNILAGCPMRVRFLASASSLISKSNFSSYVISHYFFRKLLYIPILSLFNNTGKDYVGIVKARWGCFNPISSKAILRSFRLISNSSRWLQNKSFRGSVAQGLRSWLRLFLFFFFTRYFIFPA